MRVPASGANCCPAAVQALLTDLCRAPVVVERWERLEPWAVARVLRICRVPRSGRPCAPCRPGAPHPPRWRCGPPRAAGSIRPRPRRAECSHRWSGRNLPSAARLIGIPGPCQARGGYPSATRAPPVWRISTAALWPGVCLRPKTTSATDSPWQRPECPGRCRGCTGSPCSTPVRRPTTAVCNGGDTGIRGPDRGSPPRPASPSRLVLAHGRCAVPPLARRGPGPHRLGEVPALFAASLTHTPTARAGRPLRARLAGSDQCTGRPRQRERRTPVNSG
jgi:hypothetical protein